MCVWGGGGGACGSLDRPQALPDEQLYNMGVYVGCNNRRECERVYTCDSIYMYHTMGKLSPSPLGPTDASHLGNLKPQLTIHQNPQTLSPVRCDQVEPDLWAKNTSTPVLRFSVAVASCREHVTHIPSQCQHALHMYDDNTLTLIFAKYSIFSVVVTLLFMFPVCIVDS